MLVKDLLEPTLVTIGPTDTLSAGWRTVSQSNITGACVVTDEGQLVGFVTDGDFVRACMPSEADITIYDEIMEKMDLPAGLLGYVRAMKVEDIMQPADQVITIGQDEPVLKALALMFQHRLRRIPVLAGNELVGTISRGQILTNLLVERDIDKADPA